jgi:hypothetical protein
MLLITASVCSADGAVANLHRWTEIRATVVSVTRQNYPRAELRLRIESSSNPRILRIPPEEITAESYFIQKNGQPDCSDERNSGSLAAFFLLQGDEIHAKLFSGPTTAGHSLRWYVFDISRINTGIPSKRPEGEMHGNISLSLSTDKSAYRIGEPVSMILSIKNVGKAHEILRFRSGQRYDFKVLQEGREVWLWSSGKLFTMALTSHDLAPGETLEYRATWPQTDREKKQVSPGNYEIVGVLSAIDEHRAASEAVKINIQP